jgi:hypothetical protein
LRVDLQLGTCLLTAEPEPPRIAAQPHTGPGSTEESALYGSAEETFSRLDELHAAGVTQVLINSGGDKPIESLRRFARQVIGDA